MEAILNLLTVTAIYLSALSSQSIQPATRTAFKQVSGKKDKLMDTTALGSGYFPFLFVSHLVQRLGQPIRVNSLTVASLCDAS